MADTGRLLWQGLRAAERWHDAPEGSAAERAAAETATGSLILLHRELAAGGPLPEPWASAQARQVQLPT